MKNIIRILLLTAAFLFSIPLSFAYKNPTHKSGNTQNQNKSVAEGCLAASASTDININNVRARINTGGDMWWDLQGNAEYFIPKTTYKTSMFSAALWIGGLDVNGQLKLAAQRYRQIGVDYFTGPLTTDGTASVSADMCDLYDKHFVITRAEVEEFIAVFESGETPDGYEVPTSISEYPATIDTNEYQYYSYYLAPFFDYNGDGAYNHEDGDYPYYDFENALCPKNLPPGTPIATTMEGNGILVDQVLKGDQTIWWVFNDKGNIHTETGGDAIGLEVRAQAFAFATNDEINNMTFYSYEIINRSTYRLTETYFSQWVDTDLGDAWDDYVGCDVLRGLGYCYNGDDIDGSGKPGDYGEQPPAVGVDFFQGPYIDKDGIDNPRYDENGDLICDIGINGVNFGDGIVDNERFGMRRFVYHNNNGYWACTDPDIATEYYNLLRGIWKDGERMRYCGNAHPNAGGNGPECDFMFPGDTDPCDWGTAGVPAPESCKPWTELTAGNDANDRRFMQSAGPFTLEPGAVNYITVGIPWARATSGGAWASVKLLQQVDDKCQTLFDNCFKVLDGPDAPDLTIQELDRELILMLTNRKGISNNYTNYPEDYAEIDPNIVFPDTLAYAERGDSAYRFEGYQIFQIKDATVSVTDLADPDKARLVAQCDIKNGVSKIVNFYYDESLGANVPVLEVEGDDEGIVHSFRIFEDEFATGNKRLVNHKQYYYIAIAYAYNEFKEYIPTDPLALDGQKLPYKAGRKAATGAITYVTAIPHIPSSEENGTIIRCEYGVQPKITRIEGQGNGGMNLEFTQETINEILTNGYSGNLEYDYNSGPVNVKVVDPLNVVGANFSLKFIAPADNDIDSCTWILINNDNGDSWTSERTIRIGYEQIIPEIGLSIQIEQQYQPGTGNATSNGFIEATIEYADSSKQWLGGIYDMDGIATWNWIRSGKYYDQTDATNNDYQFNSEFLDPDEDYEKILFGTWAPWALCSSEEYGPAFNISNLYITKLQSFQNIASVDVVITSDQSKWTRCPVFEMCEDENVILTDGQVNKHDLREGSTNGVKGMGWFPGYAINVETGERLNMGFGEDSWLIGENGRDMVWNPTSNYSTDLGQILWGGKHWVFIFGHNNDRTNSYGNIDCPRYDEGEWIRETMEKTTSHDKYRQYVFKDVMWVGAPMVSDSKYEFSDPANIPCDVKIRLRVRKPYGKYYATSNTGPASPQNDNYPMYTFNTENIATITGDADAAEGALDLINVVPNPYYAYSAYETNQIDNRVRITNLPGKCTITIYSVNGVLIRQYSKDDSQSFIDWDLKNYAGIPISGGIYLIYVKADGIGEKVVKWFGALRPIDLNSF